MPIRKGFSKKTMAANFKELAKSKTKRSQKQKVAIVLSTARKAAAKAGKPGKGPAAPKKRKSGKG